MKNVRKSNNKSRIFEVEKSRLRCENKTRWSSAFLNLHSVYKAHKRNIPLPDCPLSFEMVEFYLQILLPAYRFIIGFQRTKANIAEVVPSLLVLFSIWNRLARNKRFKCICLKMIESFKLKFDYELKSNVYLVAALLNPSKLSIWYWKDFNEAYATDALKELTAVCTSLMKTGKPKKAKPHSKRQLTEDEKENFLLYGMFEDEENVSEELNTSAQALRMEKEHFILLISRIVENDYEAQTSQTFWNENKKKLPNLFNAACFLLTVPASSAFVERFFSICGVICKKRCGNMSADLTIKRSFLKSNFEILNSLKI